MTTLDELVVSGSEIDRELIASVLKPFVRLNGDGKSVLLLPGWDRLKNDHKVLVFLVARKAMLALEWEVDDAVSPKEVSRETGLPGGSVRPGLARLVDSRLAAQADGGRYLVPNWAMNQVKAILAQQTEEV